MVQFLNMLKLIVVSFIKLPWLLISLNFLFDFYPLVYLIFYMLYTKEKSGVVFGASTILEE